MGLDNGICKRKVNEPQSFENEVCYWRKWWGFRNDVVSYLNYTYNTDENTFNWQLTIKDVEEIINILKSWNNQDKWEKESRSIWSWENRIPEKINDDINNLKEMLKNLEPDDIIEFYDSY